MGREAGEVKVKWRPSQKLVNKLKVVRELSVEEVDGLSDSLGINEAHPLTGDTALHAAVQAESMKELAESLKEIDRLLHLGANLNAVNEEDLTPLMCACSWGRVPGMKIAIKLIKAGADVNYVRAEDEMTALGFAASDSRPEVVQTLLEHGAKVEGAPGTAQTPLMLAARENNVAAIKLLIAAGADVNRPCQLPWAVGRTALWLAENEGARKAAAYLRKVQKGRST
jgi:ankyrin repeat protein